MKRFLIFAICLSSFATAEAPRVIAQDLGHDHGADTASHADGGEVPTVAVTQWTDTMELFMEYPEMVAMQSGRFIIHLTILDGFQPVREGKVILVFTAPDGTREVCTADSLLREGIIAPDIGLKEAGAYDFDLTYEGPEVSSTFRIPDFRVHASANAIHAHGDEPGDEITFLKEQQWKIPFATAPAVERVIDGARTLTIPTSAMLVGADEPSIFVQLDGETFEERHPVLGQRDGAYVTVTSGIQPGERVVTQGVTEVFRAADQGAGGSDHGVHEPYVTMSDADLIRYDIAVESTAPGQIQSEIEIPGEIALNDHKTAQIVARVPGMVDKLDLTLGDGVRAGQVVAILISHELADAKVDYLAAMQREELAAASFAREGRLRADQASSEQEFIEARYGHSEAQILARSARQKLVSMGFSEQQIRDLPEEPDSLLTRFEIRAQFAGTIIARNAQRGEVVAQDTAIFEIADLRTVWLDLNVPDRDLRRIFTGQSVTLVEPTDVRGFSGNVEYIHPIVDGQSRTVLVRVILPNHEGLLRPGKFVTARVAVEQVTVPVLVSRMTIQYLNDEPVVFVREGGGFVARAVALGDSTADRVAVIAGLSPGDQVATRNSFLLKSEVEKRTGGDVGHGHAH